MREQGDFALPRNSLVWLLAAQFVVILPHVPRLPVWIIGVLVLCASWRVMIWRGAWSFPPPSLKLLLVIVAVTAIVVRYRPLLGLDALVAILITAFGLKLVEMRQQRDAFLVVMLAYFIIMTAFLFDQSIFLAVLMSGAFVVVTTALIGLQQTHGHRHPLRTFRMAGLLVLQSLPLMLVLFVLFPRISPLWAVQINAEEAKSGMSDSMSPGDVAKLGLSSAPAFRVEFAGERPLQGQMYWRGLTFDYFDGRTWKRPFRGEQADMDRIKRGAAGDDAPRPAVVEDELRYSVILEPTHQPWLFAIGWPESATPGVVTRPDARLMRTDLVREKFQYEVRSWRYYRRGGELDAREHQAALVLPLQGNPRARTFAETLRARMGNDEGFIDALLAHFAREGFVYTLRPPLLGADPVDAFLFQTRRGFCEHYASAFVFLARAAGIPARVVAGYQGGEWNEAGNYLMVRQFDAHAWAEVWYPGRGWVRYDPTGAVAPDRIEQGMNFERAVASGEIGALDPLRYRDMAVLQWLRMQSDLVDYYWSKFVLGYDSRTQMRTLTRWFGRIDWKRMVILLLVAVGAVYLFTALMIFRKRSIRPLDPVTRLYLQFCGYLARHGVERRPGEGPRDLAARARRAFPDQAGQIDAIAAAYEQLAYASPVDPHSRHRSDPEVRRFSRQVRGLRRLPGAAAAG